MFRASKILKAEAATATPAKEIQEDCELFTGFREAIYCKHTCNQAQTQGSCPSSNPKELPLNIAPLSFRHPTHICCSFSTSKCKSSARKERNPALFTAHKSEAVRMVCPGKMLDLRHVDRISASGCQRERARAASDRTFRRKQPSPAPLHLFSTGP